MPNENTNTESGRIQRYITRKRWKTNGKRVDKAGNPIRFDLKAADIRQLLAEAGITIWDVGVGSDGYCLARHNDLGSYVMGNVRFTTNRQNLREKAGGISYYEERHGHYPPSRPANP